VVLWCCGVVVLWCCGVVVLWGCGVGDTVVNDRLERLVWQWTVCVALHWMGRRCIKMV
jgi:hypothetical protein